MMVMMLRRLYLCLLLILWRLLLVHNACPCCYDRNGVQSCRTVVVPWRRYSVEQNNESYAYYEQLWSNRIDPRRCQRRARNRARMPRTLLQFARRVLPNDLNRRTTSTALTDTTNYSAVSLLAVAAVLIVQSHRAPSAVPSTPQKPPREQAM